MGAGLDLDWELLCHLGNPDSFNTMLGEQFAADLIVEASVRSVFEWQVRHTRKHRRPATAKVIEDQFGVQLEDPQTTIGDLIERLRKRYVRNESQEVHEEIAKATVQDPLSVPKMFLQEGRRLNQLIAERGEAYNEEGFDRALTHYDHRVTMGPGPSLGFIELDQHFHGQRGLTFLVAAPKTYKSWVAINAVLSNVFHGGNPYLYSLELPAAETTWRLYCMKANVPYWKYLKGQLDTDDREALKQAADELKGYGTYTIDKPQPGARSVAQLVEKAINADATAVFVDQLQYVESPKGTSLGALNDPGEYWDACNEFRDASDDIPIFVVHQFNRSVMNADEMPEIQQAKGSSAIEETATLALGLYCNKDMRSSNIVELGTLITRHFTHQAWELGVELSKGCKLIMNGEA